MIRGLVIREVEPADHGNISALVARAFDREDEAKLVEALRRDGDVVLELIATNEQVPVGHILFSRLKVEGENPCEAVALAPMAVEPERQRSGIGAALIENAHHLLEERGECLCVVLGDPAYYGRFGYERDKAAGYESDYQGEYLQALCIGAAPSQGRLVYPDAFSGL